MKVLVTGVTGFIGGAAAAAFARAGASVSALVRPGSQARIQRRDDLDGVWEADLADGSPTTIRTLEAALDGMDVVLHAAAIRDRWGTSPEEYCQVNVEGTGRLVRASLGRAGRLVFVSSVGVFGDLNRLNIDERYSPGPYVGKAGYHQSKVAAESLVQAHREQLETVIVRPTITYGPGDTNGMLTRLIGLIAQRRFMRVGPGSNFIHLTYIEDLTRGLLLAATHPAAAGETIILAGPAPQPVSAILEAIEDRLGHKRTQPLSLPERPTRVLAGGIEAVYSNGRRFGLPWFKGQPFLTRDKIDTLCLHRGFSSAKAERQLGYVPEMSFSAGLDKTLAWMAESGLLRHPVRTPSLPVSRAGAPK